MKRAFTMLLSLVLLLSLFPLSASAEGETVITSGTANLAEDAKVTVTLPQDADS